MKSHGKLTDAQFLRVVRSLEAEGLIWSEVDADGNVRFYASVHRPSHPIPTGGLSQRSATPRGGASGTKLLGARLMLHPAPSAGLCHRAHPDFQLLRSRRLRRRANKLGTRAIVAAAEQSQFET